MHEGKRHSHSPKDTKGHIMQIPTSEYRLRMKLHSGPRVMKVPSTKTLNGFTLELIRTSDLSPAPMKDPQDNPIHVVARTRREINDSKLNLAAVALIMISNDPDRGIRLGFQSLILLAEMSALVWHVVTKVDRLRQKFGMHIIKPRTASHTHCPKK